MPVRADVDRKAGREACYAYLMAYTRGQGNDDALACIYASWLSGESALPAGWGLSPAAFAALMNFHFPGCDNPVYQGTQNTADSVRHDEQAELVALMISHRAGDSPSELWMASIVAAGCLGNDHLWQDLGLWCRDDLSSLMRRNFPSLAAKNVQNMKWKKFLYKQLCIAEGVYVCRSPSCEVCADYQACFGPEE
jgi:nitrogen fixation protein NifQ